MKKIFILDYEDCDRDTFKNNDIYDVVEDILAIDENKSITYSEKDWELYPDALRWITVKDNNGEITQFCAYDGFFIFNNNREFAHGLIDNICGLADHVAGIAKSLFRTKGIL